MSEQRADILGRVQPHVNNDPKISRTINPISYWGQREKTTGRIIISLLTFPPERLLRIPMGAM